LWVHGTTPAVIPNRKYYLGKRRIPSPLLLTRHHGTSSLAVLAREILGLSKMNWNNFEMYSKLPATLESSKAIAQIGALLERYGSALYDYRLFM
jgi:argonaute-like protein implicated in RNA metabolism and viral defense